MTARDDGEVTGRRTIPLERFTVRMTVGSVLALAAIAVFALALVLVQARWGPLHRLDVKVDDGLNRYFATHRGAVSWWRDVSAVLQPITFEILAVIGAAALWWAGRRRIAVFTLVTVFGAILLDTVTKSLVDRSRPTVAVVLSRARGSSFPSGHAMASCVALAVLVIVLWPRLSRRWAVPTAVGAGIVVAAVGFSRLALGVHYLSDVLGAWLLGAAWVLAMVEIFRVAKR